MRTVLKGAWIVPTNINSGETTVVNDLETNKDMGDNGFRESSAFTEPSIYRSTYEVQQKSHNFPENRVFYSPKRTRYSRYQYSQNNCRNESLRTYSKFDNPYCRLRRRPDKNFKSYKEYKKRWENNAFKRSSGATNSMKEVKKSGEHSSSRAVTREGELKKPSNEIEKIEEPNTKDDVPKEEDSLNTPREEKELQLASKEKEASPVQNAEKSGLNKELEEESDKGAKDETEGDSNVCDTKLPEKSDSPQNVCKTEASEEDNKPQETMTPSNVENKTESPGDVVCKTNDTDVTGGEKCDELAQTKTNGSAQRDAHLPTVSMPSTGSCQSDKKSDEADVLEEVEEVVEISNKEIDKERVNTNKSSGNNTGGKTQSSDEKSS